MQQKRIRVRAIILHDKKIISMYREMGDRKFYTFPGGGVEKDETEQECVIREVYEEFGIIIKPIKKVYVYENKISVEHFYVCEWNDGSFGTGNGEEFQIQNTNGVYIPLFLNIMDIPNLPLMPPEVASEFYKDYLSNGDYLRDDIKYLTEINK